MPNVLLIAACVLMVREGRVYSPPPSEGAMESITADVLTDPKLLTYKFLIVAHTVSAGRRENNLMLSQRRADVIREVLVNTFKISSKRLQAIGLGEEQLLDAARPAAAVNQRIQIATVGSALEPERPTPAKDAPAPRPPTKPAKKPR